MFEPELEKMPLEKLQKYRFDKMKKMVRYAHDNVPMYKKRFKENGITPDDIKRPEDVAKIPFTFKDDLRDHYPYGILAVPIQETVRLHASSGTTGKPTVVTYTRNDLDTWYRLMARAYATAGATSDDIVQNAYGYGLFTGGLGFHSGAERLGCTVIPIATGNTRKQISMLKDMQSTVICCTPSYAMYIAEVARKEGVDPKEDFALKIGMFGAEPWSEEARKRIEEALNITAIDNYGMSELYGPGVAIECPEQNGLHIQSDEFYPEVIDQKTGEPLGYGEKGELVFTMLSREAMPLLRYRTRDLAVLEEEECACGRTHPRIMRIKGRSDDMLIIGGVNVFPSQVEHVLMNFDGVGDQYQIVIDRDILDRLQLRVELTNEYWKDREKQAKLMETLSEELQAVLTVRARIEFLEPGAIPRSLGKAKRIVDLRED